MRAAGLLCAVAFAGALMAACDNGDNHTSHTTTVVHHYHHHYGVHGHGARKRPTVRVRPQAPSRPRGSVTVHRSTVTITKRR